MKIVLKIFLLLIFSFQIKAQLLFYQDTYRGGITSDGRSYASFDYLQADSIPFQLQIQTGSTIRQAFLVSQRGILDEGKHPTKDSPLQVKFNNILISFDSSSIVTSLFQCGNASSSGNNWMVAKDVTTLTQQSSNKLIIPNQTVLMLNDTSRQYVYNGFLLVVMYENNSLPPVNAALFLNNQTSNINLMYNLSGLNKINTVKDVGLSIYTADPAEDSIAFNLSSTIGNTYLGAIGINDVGGVPSSYYYNAPGSFYYQNNTLFGLSDDNPNNGFDTTDALVNIKNYIANNVQSFTINTVLPITANCDDYIDAFILAYTTPCPARSNKDTTLSYSICSGYTVQLNGTSNGTYTWSAPNNSLNHYNINNPIANPTITTTYIALIDSNGCQHTEQYKVNVYTTPKTDSVNTTIGICGNTAGTATIIATVGSPISYTVNGTVYHNPVISNLTAGTYTFALSNSFGCSYTSPKTFIIKDTNLAIARFYITPDSGCAPLSITCNNTSNFSGNVTNAQVWYINGDSTTTQNLNYTFTDTGKYNITLFTYETVRTCSATVTQTITVNYCPPDSINITVPNIFSPNGDGTNDTWQLIIYNRNYTISNFQCTIYDRWGLKIFSADASVSLSMANGWDGKTTSGLACPADTYFYTLKLTATNSKGAAQQKEFKGFLELVR